MALAPPMPAAMPAPADAPPEAEAPAGPMVLVTITKASDGSYMVYAGDEPDEAEAGDMSGDDAAAMGAAGDAAAPQGQPAKSPGAALKATMDILQADASGGDAPGNAADQFAAGFGGAAPAGGAAGPGQKY